MEILYLASPCIQYTVPIIIDFRLVSFLASLLKLDLWATDTGNPKGCIVAYIKFQIVKQPIKEKCSSCLLLVFMRSIFKLKQNWYPVYLVNDAFPGRIYKYWEIHFKQMGSDKIPKVCFRELKGSRYLY